MRRSATVTVAAALLLSSAAWTSRASHGDRAGQQVFRPGVDATFAAAPCPSPNVPGVPQLELGPEFHCGYLTVPENRSVHNGRMIRIAVARIKARSSYPQPDPIVYLTGGPGGTALATAVLTVQGGLNRDRDVIFVDQRGTLHADPLLSCDEVDAFQLEQTGLSPLSPATGVLDVAATSACRSRLAAAGFDLAAYNTPENSADIADLRAVLGIKQWNVYGVSYGSDLALSLLRDHPQGIRSVVVDSLVPPQDNLMQRFWPSAAQGYRALFRACAEQPACQAAYPHLATEFTRTVNRLAVHPLSVDVAVAGGSRRVVLDGYTFANLVVVLSLGPNNYAGLPRMIDHVAHGDASDAALARLDTISPSGLTGYGLTYGVF